ncbi:MAG: tryptophan synthase subunit alpha, partial [Lachnospiraceae bacterium]|nr:tryptophan synthase subunit alpha [Lachnospiraceae bacterium]
VAARFGVDVVSLIAPTSKERIRTIAKEAKGFIYVVSSMGVTGVRSKITTDIAGMVKEIRAVTDTPCAIGFGISTPEQAAEMAGYADGVIVGSAIVKLIEKYGANAEEELYRYISSMKAAVK